MAMEYPSDLINQLQISLRKEAGVTNYNPKDMTPRDIPSLQEAIQGLEPSPPYLRCKQCRGRLLRGLQSIVCVYCGAPQQKEIPPDPISFKSSFGYSWLLQSLDLDGSEAVEATDSNKALVLSDLLNIELKWPTSEPERKIDEVIDNVVNLAGVDLDSFFIETDKVTAETPAKAVEVNDTFPEDVGTSNLFISAQPSQSSSSWEAEFQQSAQVRSLPAETKSPNLFPDVKSFVPEREASFGFDDDNEEENHSVSREFDNSNNLSSWDTWQDFTSSANAQNLEMQAGSLDKDFEGTEFASFDSAFSDKAVDSNTGNLKSSQNDESVERLMSQMHNLSFMLDPNLSIPPKDQA